MPLRPAATLILARASPAGPEILLLKRSARARFMPNAHVFAGGAVDAADASPEAYASCYGLDDGRASRILDLPSEGLGYYVAAVRETFEECGLLLVCDEDGAAVHLTADAEMHRARMASGAVTGGLVQLCRRRGWRLALDRLHYVAHWVTPEGMPQRFDTRFFIARAPANQCAMLAGEEMSELIWRTPQAALADDAAGRLSLMRPTRETLAEFAAFSDVDALLNFARLPRAIPVMKPAAVDGTVRP